MTAPQKEPAGSEREAFEAHASKRALRLDRDDGEGYRYIQTDEAWAAWQARASQPSGAAGEPVAWRYRIRGGEWDYEEMPFFDGGTPGPNEEHQALYLASPSSGGWMQAPEDHARKQQQRQIADLILGTSFRVSSPLECSNGFGEDIEHRFQISNGAERFGVVITLTALAAPKSGGKSHE